MPKPQQSETFYAVLIDARKLAPAPQLAHGFLVRADQPETPALGAACLARDVYERSRAAAKAQTRPEDGDPDAALFLIQVRLGPATAPWCQLRRDGAVGGYAWMREGIG